MTKSGFLGIDASGTITNFTNRGYKLALDNATKNLADAEAQLAIFKQRLINATGMPKDGIQAQINELELSQIPALKAAVTQAANAFAIISNTAPVDTTIYPPQGTNPAAPNYIAPTGSQSGLAGFVSSPVGIGSIAVISLGLIGLTIYLIRK